MPHLQPLILASGAFCLLETLHAAAHIKVMFSLPPKYSASQLYHKAAYFYADMLTVIASAVLVAAWTSLQLPGWVVLAVLGHAALHIAYIAWWPPLGAWKALFGRAKQAQPALPAALQRVHNPLPPANKAPVRISRATSSELRSAAGLHVKRVVEWSAATSWTAKRQMAWHSFNTLGTTYDIAVHIIMAALHIKVLYCTSTALVA